MEVVAWSTNGTNAAQTRPQHEREARNSRFRLWRLFAALMPRLSRVLRLRSDSSRVNSAWARIAVEAAASSHIELANPACGNLQRGGGYEESMHVVRRLSLLLTAFTLGIAVLLGALNSRPTVSANAARLLAASTHYFDSTVVLARGSVARAIAVIQ